MKNFITITLFLSFILASCDQEPSQLQSENSYSWTEEIGSTIPIIVGIPSNHENASTYRHATLSGEAASEAQQTNLEHLLSGQEIATPMLSLLEDEHIDWQELEGLARKQFEQFSSHQSLFMAEQLFASAVQRALIPEIDTNPALSISPNREFTNEEKSILLYSSKLLVKNESPNADVIALNLRLLGDYLDEDKRKEFATKAIEHSINWYGENRFDQAGVEKEIHDVKFRQVYSSVEWLKSVY